MREWKIVVAALVIFGAGVVTGGLTVRLARSVSFRQPMVVGPVQEPMGGSGLRAPKSNLLMRHEAQMRDLMRRMDQRLDLTPQQRSRIEGLVADAQRRMQQILSETAPRTREEIRELHHRIRSELTLEQRREYDRLTRPTNNNPGGPEGNGQRGPRDRGELNLNPKRAMAPHEPAQGPGDKTIPNRSPDP